MKVITKDPVKHPEVRDIENTLEELQDIVGGYIEITSFFPGISIICNEEGKIKNLVPNFFNGRDLIVGTAIFVGVGKSSDFKSLTNSQISIIKEYFE